MWNLGDFLTANLLFCSFAFATAVLLIVWQNLGHEDPGTLGPVLCVGSLVLSTGLAAVVVGPNPRVLLSLAVALPLLFGFTRSFPEWTAIGRYFVMLTYLLTLSGLAWGAWFIATAPISQTTRLLIWSSAPFLLIALPSGMLQLVEQYEVLWRNYWTRPRLPFPPSERTSYPKVSLHVPIHAEPPELVIETLNVLARLDYANFEVLVIDNNTNDEKLWRPVEAHCQSLGDRFRFFHLDSWPGAKAGALNFALDQVSDDTKLIGVIDSDYHADPNFLKSLVPYFDNPAIGFVQTPHDYRDWENNAYLRMCYYEYKGFFHTSMVSLNERDAGITVGTMCLIRRKALVEAGGWAEWCVTEDSELAIRIHALGYSSVYLTTTFGRGLIPETFAGYKKQRFRWTAGPVQEFKHHLGLFLFQSWGQKHHLTLSQRLYHLNHGLDRINVGLRLLLTPISVAVIISMLVHREVIQVPFALWWAATVLTISTVLLNWLMYKVILRCSLMDTLGALLASRALDYTVRWASLRTIFMSKTPWHRTSKFKSLPSGLAALSAAMPELVAGLGILLLDGTAFAILPKAGLLLMLLLGTSFEGLGYLSAPLLAFLSEWHIGL